MPRQKRCEFRVHSSCMVQSSHICAGRQPYTAIAHKIGLLYWTNWANKRLVELRVRLVRLQPNQ